MREEQGKKLDNHTVGMTLVMQCFPHVDEDEDETILGI